MNGKDLDRNRGNAHILRKLGLEADRLRLGASTKPCTNRSLGSLRSLGMPMGSASSPQVLAGWSEIPRLPSVARDAYGFGKLTTGPCRIVRDPSAPFGRSGCLWVR